MIKVERMENGFMIELDGSNGDLIEEIAHAAGAYHVKAIKDFMKKRSDLDVKYAIKASVELFGLIMKGAMEKQLGINEDSEEIEPISIHEVISFDDAKKKGGVVQ